MLCFECLCWIEGKSCGCARINEVMRLDELRWSFGIYGVLKSCDGGICRFEEGSLEMMEMEKDVLRFWGFGCLLLLRFGFFDERGLVVVGVVGLLVLIGKFYVSFYQLMLFRYNYYYLHLHFGNYNYYYYYYYHYY